MSSNLINRKVVIDGGYIIGDISDTSSYFGDEGVILFDFCPETEYNTPSTEEQAIVATHLVEIWNNWDLVISDRERLKEALDGMIKLWEKVAEVLPPTVNEEMFLKAKGFIELSTNLNIGK